MSCELLQFPCDPLNIWLFTLSLDESQNHQLTSSIISMYRKALSWIVTQTKWRWQKHLSWMEHDVPVTGLHWFFLHITLQHRKVGIYFMHLFQIIISSFWIVQMLVATGIANVDLCKCKLYTCISKQYYVYSHSNGWMLIFLSTQLQGWEEIQVKWHKTRI